MKTALLVIDYINGIVRDGSCADWAKTHPIVSNVNKIIAQARMADISIYFIRLAFDEQYSKLPKHSKMFNYVKQHKKFILGNADTEFVNELDFQAEKDIVINKTGASPFTGNDLQIQLNTLGIEHLIFTGVATDNAIDAGVRYAHDQGFFTTIVEDTCGAASEELHTPIINALAKVANHIIDTKTCVGLMKPSRFLLDPKQYPFLEEVKNYYTTIKQEYLAYIKDPKIDREILSPVLKPKSSVIKPGKLDTKHQIYPFYIHGKKLIDIIKEYQLTYQGVSLSQIEEILNYIEKNHFKETRKIINKIYQDKDNGVMTCYFSVISPQVRVKLHVNNDHYMHRAYLGIKVPEGDIAMKIGGDIVKWIEGDFIVLDVTTPHCPHNLTNEPRIALLIDFYRPEQNRQEMESIQQKQFKQRMQDNPYGYGIYGTDDAVDQQTLEKFGEYGEKMLS